jgi:hypothetical protein
MKRVFHGVVSVAVVTLFNVLALGLHAAALQPVHVGHSAGTSSHQTSSTTCLTICTTATLNRNEIIDETDKDKDDTPQPPFYIQFQGPPLIALEKKHSEEARLATDREPPPGGQPAYIVLTVFRA